MGSHESHHSERKYQALFENSITALFITKPDGSILEANNAACRMFGYTHEEICELGREGIISADTPGLAEMLKERREKGSVKGELIGIRKNGDRIFCEFSSSLYKAADGEVLACVTLVETTKKKLVEERLESVINNVPGVVFAMDSTDLKQARLEMELLIDNTDESFILMDKDLRILSFNTQFDRLYQDYFGKKVRKGESILDYARTDRREKVRKIYERVLKGETEHSLLTVPLSDGSEKIISITYKPARGDHNEIVGAFVTASDVTKETYARREQKAAEAQILSKTRQLDVIAEFNSRLIKENSWQRALKKSLESFGRVVSADRVYYFENDFTSEKPGPVTTMIMEWTSGAVTSELDNPLHQKLLFDDIRLFIDELIAGEPFNRIVREIEDESFREFLKAQQVKSLLALPVYAGNRFRGFIGFDDCTDERVWSAEEVSFLQTIILNLAGAIENKDSEMALQAAFDEKNEILERIGDGFFAVDSSFTVTYWNKQAEKLLFTNREEILGEDLWSRFDKSIAKESYRNYKRAMEEQVSLYFEDYYEPIDRWFDVNVYPSLNGLSVFFKDKTDEKQADLAFKELYRELELRSKELAASNAELEQFAFVASHDLQEPLRMITSFLAQLEKKYDAVLDEKGKKYIYFAIDGAKRMRQIILDLLEFSRVGRVESEREEVDLNELIHEVLSLNRKLIEESDANIKLDQLPVITAAKSPIRQLFQNLIQNAIKYQDNGTRPVIQITCQERVDEWQFSVRDNGIGIKQEYSEKIFTIFQRLHGKEEYSGTGMGLAICKKIVEDHGGNIGVKSAIGEGSTFYFTIRKP
ncbi:MAG: PAS domain S-box protein [Balneolaceae bacterium]